MTNPYLLPNSLTRQTVIEKCDLSKLIGIGLPSLSNGDAFSILKHQRRRETPNRSSLSA
ncbi:14570_t:CDS:2 [Cetraspora pellucida]|uniref:14570_t:CDS:1 n=1 Tax=Cetraspora pellucida TaxID=1433469 RepID=A0A9N9HFW4_9GLOM|nr:14570_t:CDS:2 [Cetraspora pellucida]